MARRSRFEHLYKRSVYCNNCGRLLTAETSIKRGYGRDCWEALTDQGPKIQAGSLIDKFLWGRQ